MDYDNRRISAALVGIAKPDTPTTHQRQRVCRDCALELPRQFGSREIPRRRRVRSLDSRQQVADSRAVQRGNRDALRKIQEWQLAVEFVSHMLAVIRTQAIPFVGHDDECPAPFEDEAEQADILVRYAFARVEHGDNNLGLLDRLQRLDDAEFLDGLVDPGPAPDAGGVDQHVFAVVAFEGHLDCVTRRTGLVIDDEPVLTQQAVDERRLADVRSTDYGDA